jgi:2-methylisocitrate lyase-like PEP mutase family enzyme
MHRPGDPVCIANVWDVATARWAHEAGYRALGSSSLAVAESLGHLDHEGAPAELMLWNAEQLVASVPIPVTVDAEAGWGLDPETLVERLTGVGAAGFNIEETRHATGEIAPVADQERYVAGLRKALDTHDDPPVLNARVDAFLQAYLSGESYSEADLLPDVVDRANRYLAAGADCVFAIVAAEPSTVSRLVEEIDGPVNTTVVPGGLTADRLAGLGVARVSFGPLHWFGFKRWFTEQLAADGPS